MNHVNKTEDKINSSTILQAKKIIYVQILNFTIWNNSITFKCIYIYSRTCYQYFSRYGYN